jgi:hypothetical protein
VRFSAIVAFRSAKAGLVLERIAPVLEPVAAGREALQGSLGLSPTGSRTGTTQQYHVSSYSRFTTKTAVFMLG